MHGNNASYIHCIYAIYWLQLRRKLRINVLLDYVFTAILFAELPTYRSPAQSRGGGVARAYTKLPSLRHTPRQVRNRLLCATSLSIRIN